MSDRSRVEPAISLPEALAYRVSPERVPAARVRELWAHVIRQYRLCVFAEQRLCARHARAPWSAALGLAALGSLTWWGMTKHAFSPVAAGLFPTLLTIATVGWALAHTKTLQPPPLPTPADVAIDACVDCQAPVRRSATACGLCGSPVVAAADGGARVRQAVQLHLGVSLPPAGAARPGSYVALGVAGAATTALLLGVAMTGVSQLGGAYVVLPASVLAWAWPTAGLAGGLVLAAGTAYALLVARAQRRALGEPLVPRAVESLRILGQDVPPPLARVEPARLWISWLPPFGQRAAFLVVLWLLALVWSWPTEEVIFGVLLPVVALAIASLGGTELSLSSAGLRVRTPTSRREVPLSELVAIAYSPRPTWLPVGAIGRWSLVAVTREGRELLLSRALLREHELVGMVERLDAPLRARRRPSEV